MTMLAFGLSNAGATQAQAGTFVDTEFELLAQQGLSAAAFEKSEIYFGYAVLGGSEFDAEIDGYSTLTVSKPICGPMKVLAREIRRLERKGGLMALVVVNASEYLRSFHRRVRDHRLDEQLVGEALTPEDGEAMKAATTRGAVRKSEINRVVSVLRDNGIYPTGAEILPDGTVRLLSEERIAGPRRDGSAFDAWWAENGKKTSD